MKIWIDADACPGAIMEIIIKAAEKRRVPACFVANKPLGVPTTTYLSAVLIGQGADVADDYIVEEAKAGDLVITQDIPLAARLVENRVVTMNPHGILFTDANIGERLSARNLMHDLRGAGMITGGPKPFGDKEKRQFANTFDQQLTRLIREAADKESP